jgi:hypothetical protein
MPVWAIQPPPRAGNSLSDNIKNNDNKYIENSITASIRYNHEKITE